MTPAQKLEEEKRKLGQSFAKDGFEVLGLDRLVLAQTGKAKAQEPKAEPKPDPKAETKTVTIRDDKAKGAAQ